MAFRGQCSVTHAKVSSPLRHRLSSERVGSVPGRAAALRFTGGSVARFYLLVCWAMGNVTSRAVRLVTHANVASPLRHRLIFFGSHPFEGLSVELGLGRGAGRGVVVGTPRGCDVGAAPPPPFSGLPSTILVWDPTRANWIEERG